MSEEIFDIVDEQGRIIGQAPRSRCHGDPSLLHRVVHVFVFNGAGEVFLQQRSRSKRIQPGRWDTSVGGHLEPQESYEAAALREMAEELGIEGIVPGFVHQYIWRSPVESELVRTYRCVHEGPFELHPQEIEQGRFFGLGEVAGMRGTGQLTPNLEHELDLLGLLGSRQGSAKNPLTE